MGVEQLILKIQSSIYKLPVRLTKILSIAIFSSMSLGTLAQDLIASQAPSDRKMQDINKVKLNRTINVDLSDPASDIYTNWTRKIRTEEGHVPANFKVDLRGFFMPTPSRIVTSKFGRRWGRQHEGLDIKVYTGDTIRAAFDGKVRIVDFNRRGYGYYVVIRHPNGLETLYGHLSKQLVREDQIVRAGEVIGLGGSTGRSFGSHLHFETRLLGQPIDPALMFDFANQDVTGDFFAVRNRSLTKGTLAAANVEAMEEQAKQREGVLLVSSDLSAVEAAENVSGEETANVDILAVQPSSKKASRSSRRSQRSATYRVKSGDNLSAIAKRHGTTVDRLCRLNGISKRTILRPGQVLKCS